MDKEHTTDLHKQHTLESDRQVCQEQAILSSPTFIYLNANLKNMLKYITFSKQN